MSNISDRLLPPALRFSASILLGLLAGLALQVWTLAFLGRLGGEALHVRAVFTPVGFLILAVTEGLVVAAQVSAGIATRHGRRDVLRPLPTFLTVGAGALLLIAALFTAVSQPILTTLAVRAEERPAVVGFVVAVCVSSAVSLVPYAGGAILRGQGRPVVSSGLSLAFTGLSMATMAVLGGATRLGVLAVPVATLIASGLVGVAVAVPLRGSGPLAWSLRRDALGELRTFGAPVAATFLLLSVVNFGFLRVLRGAPEAEVAGFALGQSANTFFMVVALAVGSGVAVAVNLRPGERRPGLELAGLTTTIKISLPGYAVVGAAAFGLRHRLSGLLTTDPAVAAVIADYFAWTGPTFVVFGGTLALLTYLEQVGRGTAALALNACYFLVLLTVALLLPAPVGSAELTRLLAAGNVGGFLTCWWCARRLLRR